MSAPTVEILFFKGCPNYDGARELVVRVSEELGVSPEVSHIEVADPEAAVRERFLGSPTIRVNGRDIEPGAGTRDQFMLACRVYRIEGRFGGLPDDAWLRDTLRTSGGGS